MSDCVIFVGRGLVMGLSPSMESCRLCIGSRNLKSREDQIKVCRYIILMVKVIIIIIMLHGEWGAFIQNT
jgi:hypothetical protein